MLQPTRLISTPFAQEGEKTEIQNVTGEFDNSATYRLGFPPLTMQSIRLGGKPPKGTDFNGVLFDITENISFLCKGGRYQYNAGLSTLIGGYPEGSNLLLDDNVTEVVSTVAGNQNNPNTDMTGWTFKPNRTTAEYVLDASGETQQQVNYNGGSKWHSRVGGYLENERVVLTSGDIVKSTVDGNANDPNVNMTGWVSVGNGGVVESIADLLAINNPKDGSRVYVKSYSEPLYVLNTPYQGGNTFIYQSQYAHINDSVFIINGWVAQDQTLTFEKCGVVVNSPTDQSDAMNFAIRYAISSRKYNICFENQGRVYVAKTVEVPPILKTEGGVYTHVYTTQLTLDTSKVSFESIADTAIEMFVVLRPKTRFTTLTISNDTYKRTGTGLRIGLTRADADRYGRENYYIGDTGECKFDSIDFSYLKNGIILQAGYHNYYNQFERINFNAVFFGIKFARGAENIEIVNGETINWNMANTRCYIGNMVHTVGCISIWIQCCETLYLNNLTVENIDVEDYLLEMPTLDKVPTAVYIEEKGTGNRLNNKNIIQRMMSEACDRVIENYGRDTDIQVYAERWKDYPNGTPFIGKPFTSGFQSSPVNSIKDLRNVSTYGKGVTSYGVNIEVADYVKDNTISQAYPTGIRLSSELYGNITYYPLSAAGQIGNERLEVLFSSYPENEFWYRRSNASGSQNNAWTSLTRKWGIGGNYLVYNNTQPLDSLFVRHGGFRSYQVSIPSTASAEVKASIPKPSAGEFYGAVLAQSTSNELKSGCLIAIGTYPKGVFIKFFGDSQWSQIQTVAVT